MKPLLRKAEIVARIEAAKGQRSVSVAGMTNIETEMYARRATSPLRLFRVAAGLTQAELAERSGIARITVGALERGENSPHLATARRLAGVLGCSAEQLFPNDDDPASTPGRREESVRTHRHGES
jgi:DNA-binding XRE family transcriptional regulator